MNPTIKRTLNQWRNGPYITYSLIAIQTTVFLLNYLLPSLQLQEKGVMFGPLVAYLHEYWRFITPIFLHFGLSHFAINTIVLYFIGQQVEALYGHSRFLLLYLLSGMLGNAFSFGFNAIGVQSAGSSTAIFGIFGAFLILGVYFRHNPAIQGMVRQFALFVLLSLVFGMFDQSIDIWGHVGGIVGGLLLGNTIALPQNPGRYSIHTRILTGIVYVFLFAICVFYGLKKYGILV